MATTEERLAALEKQMAAWIDQQPTNYYTHQYSGEEIDNAVSRALPNGAIDQAAGTFVRPNLLDNWYFGNPVNQLGQTGYTGNWYSVDRWFFDTDSGSCSLTLTNDGLKFIATASATGIASLKQDIDPTMLSALAGKTVTLSLLGKTDITQQVLFYVNSKVAAVNFSQAVNGVCMTTLTYTFPEVLTGAAIFVYGRSYSGAGEGTILAAKLELGPTQTLAHKEGDRWVINEVPDYGEQMRRCQRYYIKYDTIKANGYISNAAKSYYMPIFLPEAMRTTPTILGTPKIRVRFNGGYSSRFVGGTFTAPDSWGSMVISANAVTLAFNVNTAVDPNNIPVSIEVEGLELSADL